MLSVSGAWLRGSRSRRALGVLRAYEAISDASA